MPLKKIYTYADARAAVDRSNGQRLVQGAADPATQPRFPKGSRRDPNKGTGYGHEYMHRGPIKKYDDTGDHPSGLNTTLSRLEQNKLHKSRTENCDATYRLTEYLLNTPTIQGERPRPTAPPTTRSSG